MLLHYARPSVASVNACELEKSWMYVEINSVFKIFGAFSPLFSLGSCLGPLDSTIYNIMGVFHRLKEDLIRLNGGFLASEALSPTLFISMPAY